MRLLRRLGSSSLASPLSRHLLAAPPCRLSSSSSSSSSSTTTTAAAAAASPVLEMTSFFLPSRDGRHQLHVKRIRRVDDATAAAAAVSSSSSSSSRPVCLLFHGALSDGRVFYSVKSQKGLGCFLAREGNCDVFVADFRGRGMSSPPVSTLHNHGQHELIVDDVRALSDGVTALLKEEGRGGGKQHWLAHSWGGIILSSALARFPAYASSVASQVWFGTKRVITVHNLERTLKIDLVWGLAFPVLGKLYGYVPARKFRLGADDEPLPFLDECSVWVRGGEWKDVKDGFDYKAAVEKLPSYPPTLSLAGQGDHVLGNPKDVLSFVHEHQPHADPSSSSSSSSSSLSSSPSSSSSFQFQVLSKQAGNRHDYDHSSLLLHKDCEKDHFPMVLDWILPAK